MTNEERRKAAEWFRNRAKNCQMPGARRMYEIATEALEMAIRALEGDGDTISRKAVMKEFSDFVRKSNNSDFAPTPTWNDAVSLVGSMPSAQPEKTCCGYDEKELIAFAIACRRNEVDEKDLKTFAQNCEFAWKVIQEEFESKIREAFEKWTGGKSDAD